MSRDRASNQPDFARLAPEYDRIRPVDDNWWAVYDVVVREGDLRGRRVLDVGCGIGNLARALAEREGAEIVGVDATRAMLEQARARVPESVELREARAEQLPFPDASFERAAMWLVIHLVDRARAFAEARRVLGPGGRLAIVSFDESYFRASWLARLFPSLEAIDLARFPTRAALEAELREAGFDDVRTIRIDGRHELSRDVALERIEAGHISTFDLLPPDEVEAGRARARRELPERVESTLKWLLAFADTRS